MSASGGGAPLVVDFSQMKIAIERMTGFQRDVERCLEDIDRAMVSLRQTWHGTASDAQAQAQSRWREGAEQMREALSQLNGIAQTARSNYADAVTKNSEMWGV
jgi:WXG100 family type VII secretion target